jgi:hypothetical protein
MTRMMLEQAARHIRHLAFWAVIAVACAIAPVAMAQDTRMDIYGFAMLDMGYQSQQSDPLWFDVVRPTKLPAFEKQFGEDGRWFAGVRQSRLGVKTFTQTEAGELRTTFEFEMFGVGADAGQTTIRLRHAYGEIGQFGAGQTWSPFMDIDVFPNSIEYWGPNGMVFFRNVQVRWMPIQGDTRMTIALERPGASADGGDVADRIQLQNIQGRFPMPDLSGEFRIGQPWGYLEIAGIIRKMHWDDTNPAAPNLSGEATGWGLNLSTNLKVRRGVLRAAIVGGEGIQNYMNDAPADVGATLDTGSEGGFKGEAIPMTGISAFYDINWNEKWSSTAGYSRLDIDNLTGQSASAFHRGQYALVNLLHYPAKNVMLGGELQWGYRKNARDNFKSDDVRFQFSARYNFSTSIGAQ